MSPSTESTVPGLPAGHGSELPALIRQYAEPLPDLQDPAFAELFDRYGDARVVLIGEASHGTSDFYRTRAAITQRLIERHGFNIVAVEADWPDAARLDRFARQRETSVWSQTAFARFPSWMWRNTDVSRFIHWLHHHNQRLSAEQRVEFRGLDVYSLRNSIDEVLRYLDRVDPQRAQQARRRYGCLSPWQDDPARYGLYVEHGKADSCEDAVVAQLNSLLSERLEALAQDEEALFNAAQNARVVRAAEQYYRVMYRGSAASWNLRDRHMFDTLQTLLEHRGEQAKAVVWAHNSHIGNAAATAMGWRGEFNIGQLSRLAWGRDAVLIGMGTDHGRVAAADDWDGQMQIKQVRAARPDSWEYQFHRNSPGAALLDWRAPERQDLREALSVPLLERAIGVIYRPQTELHSHYFEAVLADQFDAFIWLDETGPIKPLSAPESASHDDETYPFGI
ncbi:erythromycin esterase family protein [Pseudomonas zhanjiangensis]|uniref:Erythromycin esterase family protein n=1 Tax=Pseudomonas zhanjiangensis TaxID=3239015 RepID=A0ABV3YXW7_9PSED